MAKITKDDEVIVLAGNDKGKHGKVLKIIPKANKAVVEGMKIAKKHQKPVPQKGIQGGIVDKEMPIQLSNLAVYNAATGKGEKVGYKVLEDGKKVRYFKKSGEVIDV